MTDSKPTARTYALTLSGLLALTLLTSLLGLVNLGPMTIVLAVLIAMAKAALILSLFMHALYGSRLVLVAIAAGVMWLLLLFTLTMADYVSRGWLLPSGK